MSIVPQKYQYRSPFEAWDAKATVRSSPRRQLDHEEDKVYYTPELVPEAQHPAVVERGLGHTLLAERLCAYHHFTIVLEHTAVNRVAQWIALGALDFTLPSAMRIDAHKVYSDEGYHALFCEAQIREVEAATGIVFCPSGVPSFLQRLRQLQASVAPEVRQLAMVLFVCVSETLITGTLTSMAKDTRVVSGARQVIADHARDEARHHAYFSALFECLWPQVSRQQQQLVGLLLPHFILAFLQPDYAHLRLLLRKYGLRKQTIARVIEDAYPAARVRADARQAAHATLRLFARQGVFDEPQTAEVFAASGLLPLSVS